MPGKAKQMVPTSHDGYVIGDGILFYAQKDVLLFVGRAPTVNWLQYQAETGGDSPLPTRVASSTHPFRVNFFPEVPKKPLHSS